MIEMNRSQPSVSTDHRASSSQPIVLDSEVWPSRRNHNGTTTEDTIVYRGWRRSDDGERRAALFVVPAEEHPPPSVLNRLGHEYGLRDELDPAWAVRPRELVRDGNRVLLVLDDTAGEPLQSMVGKPMAMGLFLRLATAIAAALRRLHARGIVHKDLKPTNIVVNDATGEVRLTGFGIASRLPRERQAPDPPETCAGTLAYMAPEQTGRMNRSIDSRADLYSLGVTFYQMLSGDLPFTASDPLEWVHCHVARQPLVLGQRNGNIPAPLSQIVMRLLAKTTEDRYQTAAGLERDLQHCFADWEVQGRIDEFPLGRYDTPDRLLIPETLYGRERELDTLLTSFDRIVKSGAPELVLVSGYSGIGKSSIVNELHRVLVPPRGLFASGKFDQYKRNIPYATLAQAFQSLVRSLLGKSDTELAAWRSAFLEALDLNAQLITDLVPELKLIIGHPLPVPELDPQQAKTRFQLVLRRFIATFARPEHPLALFLDDLQWLDAATLDLLEDLLTRSDLQHLMLIGAYRDNEVDAAHPLIRKLDSIRQAGAPLHEIRLAPLTPGDLEQLISDALRCESEDGAPLARLVHEKTAGNPFFVAQFLDALADESLLRFDHDATCWSWDLSRIHGKGYTDNVVDLVAGKLTRLPAETQKTLQYLACLGNLAATKILCTVVQLPENELHAALWPAVHQEFVERLESSYRFIHDRVQEAAYSQIPETLRANAHLRIGRLLAAEIAPAKRAEMIFDIVSQLNRGAALITEQEERDRLAAFNLRAGERAAGAAAYASALTYYTAGLELLAEDRWDRQYDLTFALELNRAECELLTGQHAVAEERLSLLTDHADSLVRNAGVTSLKVELYTTLVRAESAIAVCFDYLRLTGVEWSAHPTEQDVRAEYERLWRQIGSRSIDELVDLPPMEDPAALATMDVLTKMMPAATFTDENLGVLVATHMANISLQYGNTDASSCGYVWVAMMAGPIFGDYPSTIRFGQLGIDLVDKLGLDGFAARVYLVFGIFVIPWIQHISAGQVYLRRTFEAGTKSGDLTYSAYSFCNMVTNLLVCGAPLQDVEREAISGIDFSRTAQYGLVVDLITPQLGLIRSLQGLTKHFGSFNDAEFDEAKFEQHLKDPNLNIAACWYWIRKMQARFWANDYAEALEAVTNAQEFLWTSRPFFEHAEYQFYAALVRACSCEQGQQTALHMGPLVAHHQQLEIWAKVCPDNFEARAALVGAEIARIEGREVDAMRLYEAAIRSARDNGFVHNEAIAYERASAFYRGRGFDQIADDYLRSARYCYLRWGAHGKVKQLDSLHLRLAASERPPRAETMDAATQRVDVTTVVKASQAVSSEIELAKLIERLMTVALENAGANRGLLILPRKDEYLVEAVAEVAGGEILLRQEASSDHTAPQSLIRYVVRTQESVILDDATRPNQFAADEYLIRRRPRSVFCLPLMRQGAVVGVLYLENTLTSHVFAPDRTALLSLLASQLAISLENARLYTDLREREAKIRHLVDANVIGIFITDLEGRLLEANDAFLQMIGYGREDLISGRLRWTELTPAEWRDRSTQALNDLKRTGAFQPYEKEYFRKDSTRVPVLIGGAAFGEERDQGVAFVLDLTERKRTEEALRESETKFRDYAETTSDWLWEIGPDYKLTLLTENAFASDLAPRIGGAFWDHALDLETDSEKWRHFRASLDSRKPFQDFVYCTVGGAGSPMHVKASGRPVFDANGEFRGYRGTGTDVTANVRAQRAEESLRTVEAELAHVNRVMTLGQLTASIAHEVKQPIAAARNNARAALNFLDQQPADLGEVREALGCIVDDSDRAGDIIDRIHGHIKKASPRKQRFDLNKAINEVLLLAQSAITENGISVQTSLTNGRLSVEGDRVQLQQVVMNLVLNAIEAMREVRAPERELLISTRDEPNGVSVEVRDSGPGFALSTPDHVFEAFYTTKTDGLGLGLSICRSIIESHNGKLWARANPHRGASFQFALPTIANTAS